MISCLCCFVLVLVLILLSLANVCRGVERIDGRHSYSLSTFDTKGRLEQVERAIRATNLGSPVVGVCRGDHIVMASLQALPSKFIIDDGTSRFTRITPSIVVVTTGISADGRIVAAAAQRVAVQYEYTFDEPMPIEKFLEEMSLLFQEYTLERGVRPFGCNFLVAYLPSRRSIAMREGLTSPQFYLIDPSGCIQLLGSHVMIGTPMKESVSSELATIASSDNTTSPEEDVESLSDLLKSYVEDISKGKEEMSGELRIIKATFSRDRFHVEQESIL